MTSDILLLASKRVGSEVAAHLSKIGAPVRGVFVPDESEIEGMAVPCGASVGVLDADRLVATERRYGWLINAWCPAILRASFLRLFERRLNIHPGLVPGCRGNDTAAWTIRRGRDAGVSLLEMGETVDAGDVYAQRRVPWSFPTRGAELHDRLQRAAVELFIESWPAIYRGDIRPRPQAGTIATHKRSQTNGDRIRDGGSTTTNRQSLEWALAHNFAPGTTAEVIDSGTRYAVTVQVRKLDA